MKNYLYLLLLIITVACSTGDEMSIEQEESQMTTYELNLEVKKLLFNFETQTVIYISNAEGEIVLESSIVDFQNYNFVFEGEENEIFDFTMLRRYNVFGNDDSILLQTLENFKIGSYVLGSEISTDDRENFQVTVELIGLGDPDPIEGYYSEAFGEGIYESNGNHYTNHFVRENGNYFAAFKNVTDPYPRYLFETDIVADFNFSGDYSSLPFASDLFTINLPNNDGTYRSLIGYTLNSSGLRTSHWLKQTSSNVGFSQLSSFVKDDLFDSYVINGNYFIDDRMYPYKKRTTELINTISLPSFSFNLQNTSLDNFEATTAGNYDYFRIAFNYGIIAQDLNVDYTVLGAKSAQISSSKKVLFDNIFANEDAVSSDLLDFSSFKLIESDGYGSYQDVLEDWIIGNLSKALAGDFAETVSTIE